METRQWSNVILGHDAPYMRLPIRPINKDRFHLIHLLIQPQVLWKPSRTASPDTPYFSATLAKL